MLRRGLGRAYAGYRRTALVGLATTAILVVSFGTASGQSSSAARPQADTAFTNGTAKATAVVFRVAPGVGNLQLGISSGVAVSEVKNTIAQSQAETLDLGLIGSTLTAPSCSGLPAPLTPDQLPQPERVDSRGGDTSSASDQTPIAGATLGAGRKEVTAKTTPAATAVATVVGSVGPLLTFDGGQARAVTDVIPGKARESHASVGVDLDIAGFLKLGGLRWDAYHRTGQDPRANATFDIGTASLLGVPIPLDSLKQAEDTINEVLGYSGITITFPRVERFTTPADLVRITPLRIELRDTPVGKQTLGPVLNLTRAQREQLFDQIAKVYCALAAGTLLADIGLDVVSGTGFLTIEIGGAEATTGDLVLEDPFGKVPPLLQDLLPSPVLPGIPPVPALPGPIARSPQPAANIGPLEDHCQSEHPLRHTSCSHGELMALGLLGVGATLGVGALDWWTTRRRRSRAEVVS